MSLSAVCSTTSHTTFPVLGQTDHAIGTDCGVKLLSIHSFRCCGGVQSLRFPDPAFDRKSNIGLCSSVLDDGDRPDFHRRRLDEYCHLARSSHSIEMWCCSNLAYWTSIYWSTSSISGVPNSIAEWCSSSLLSHALVHRSEVWRFLIFEGFQ